VDLIIALYFAVGAGFAQISHTIHASSMYGNKRVRVLESYVRWFERNKVVESFDELKLKFLPGSQSEANWPSQLPEVQQNTESVPDTYQRIFTALGLQATNIYYCVAASIMYSIISFVVLILYEVNFSSLISTFALLLIYILLMAVSFFGVGSSILIIITEFGMIFNSYALIPLSKEIISPSLCLSVLQIGGLITISAYIFWLNFQKENDKIDYQNLGSVYFVILHIIYNELVGVVIWTTYIF
jgi:hypothetical protein